MAKPAQHEFLRFLPRRPVPPPTHVHKDMKKEQNKKQCRCKCDK